MATYQERLYLKVNGPLADRFQSRAMRRAVAVATIVAVGAMAVAFALHDNRFWMLAAASFPLAACMGMLNLSLRGIFELKEDRLDEYQISMRNRMYKTAYGFTLVFLVVVATTAAGLELEREVAFAVAMLAFFTSALAPRLFLAWNLDDNPENSNG